MSNDPVIWVAALLTIGAYTYLFKENELYKAVEHLYIGVAAGYTVVLGYTNILSKVWTPLTTKGQVTVLIPAFLGLLLFAPYVSRPHSWLRRYPIGVIVGIGAALSARATVVQQLVRQISATLVPLTTVNNIIIVLGTVTTLTYFFFTFRQSPLLKISAECGKWVLMVTFGAAFGAGIMGRISLLIGRLFLLFRDWIPLIPRG